MRREKDVQYCEEQGIQIMAWGPLARAFRFGHPVLKAVADKHKKSEANVMLRWSLQHGCKLNAAMSCLEFVLIKICGDTDVCIPKSAKQARIKVSTANDGTTAAKT